MNRAFCVSEINEILILFMAHLVFKNKDRNIIKVITENNTLLPGQKYLDTRKKKLEEDEAMFSSCKFVWIV